MEHYYYLYRKRQSYRQILSNQLDLNPLGPRKKLLQRSALLASLYPEEY
jgi:hypothetical protein